jgi:hypothetical protein
MNAAGEVIARVGQKVTHGGGGALPSYVSPSAVTDATCLAGAKMLFVT